MKRLMLVGILLLLPAVSMGTPTGWGDMQMPSSTEKVDGCDDTLHISNVEEGDLISALKHIKKCVRSDTKLDVLVSGPGGSVITAQAFFDNMRIMGLHKHVRFIAYGVIASATNLVWLAADERVAMSSTLFVLHELNLNGITGEDPELVLAIKNIHVKSTVKSVELAAGKKAGKMWEMCFVGKDVGFAFTGKEAIENGWATELWEYPK
jgi:ATP-dependent protease ClpP protease subunit